MLGLKGLSEELNKAVTQPSTTGTSANDALATSLSQALMGWLGGSVYSTITTVLIFVVVLFVFYGSFLYLTAYGDENRATLAKKTLTYAFVGLAIALLAFGIASYARAILVKKDYTDQTNFNQVPLNAPTGDGTVKDQPDQPGPNLIF